MATENYALGWDDEITVESKEFSPIPEGDYAFEVISVERGQFNGSAKMPACPEAIVTVRLTVGTGTRQLIERIKLVKSLDWIIDQFFKSVGLRDEAAGAETPLLMQWARTVGLTGACHVSAEEYNGKTYNHVARWYKPSEGLTKLMATLHEPAGAGLPSEF